MYTKYKKWVVGSFILVIILLGIFLALLFSPYKSGNTVRVRAALSVSSATTCAIYGLKIAPENLGGQQFLDDYKRDYCTDTTPINSGDGACFTKTLACSNIPVNSPNWCVSAACYGCYNEKVNNSICTAKPTISTSCSSKNEYWKSSKFLCSNDTKYAYGVCTADGYRCMCDDAGSAGFPTIQKDVSCNTVATSCSKKNDEWESTKFLCSGKYEYNVCIDSEYKCECDKNGTFTYPTIQKDMDCSVNTKKVSCEMTTLLNPLVSVYRQSNYEEVYKEIKKNFLLFNTQSSNNESVCYMSGAKYISTNSGGYCGNLQLSGAISNICSCMTLIDVEIQRNPSYDYNEIPKFTTCYNAITAIVEEVEKTSPASSAVAM